MSGSTLRFSTTADGTHGGGSEYTRGIARLGASDLDKQLVILHVQEAGITLYPYEEDTSGMGASAQFATREPNIDNNLGSTTAWQQGESKYGIQRIERVPFTIVDPRLQKQTPCLIRVKALKRGLWLLTWSLIQVQACSHVLIVSILILV